MGFFSWLENLFDREKEEEQGNFPKLSEKTFQTESKKPTTSFQKPTVKKEPESFPSFSEVRSGQPETVTDQFQQKPNIAQRANDFAAGAVAKGLSNLNQAGTFAVDQGVLREQERKQERERINHQMQDAAAKRDFDLTNQLMLQQGKQGNDNLFFNILDMAGWNTSPDKYQNRTDLDPLAGEAARMDKELKRGLSSGQKKAVEFAQGAADLGANALISGVSGVPLPLIQGVQQAGDAGSYALQQGKDPDTALAYATASGAAAYATEKLGGIAGNWGGKLLNKAAGSKAGQAILQKIPQKAIDYIAAKSLSDVSEIIGAGAAEGLEEFNEYGLQLLLRNVMLDEKTPYDIREALANAGAGAVFGSAVRGADLLTDLDVSGIRDAAKTKLESGIQQGTAKPEYNYPLLNPQRTAVPETDAETIQFIDDVLAGNLVTKQPEFDSPLLLQNQDTKDLQNYWDQIDGVFNGTMPERDIIRLGNTPERLTDLGAEQRPVTMSQSVARKIAYPENYMGGKHNLGISALKHIPEQLENPLAVLQSKTQKNSFVILTEWEDPNGYSVVIPMHLDKQGNLELENQIPSAYGKQNLDALIGENQENVLYTKNNEDIHQLLADRLQLPAALEDDTLIAYNIAQNSVDVNNDLLPNVQPEALNFRSAVDPSMDNQLKDWLWEKDWLVPYLYPQGDQILSNMREEYRESPIYRTGENTIRNEVYREAGVPEPDAGKIPYQWEGQEIPEERDLLRDWYFGEEKQNFNSPLLLRQKAQVERDSMWDVASKREQDLQEFAERERRRNPERIPPEETEFFRPSQTDLQDASGLINQQAETTFRQSTGSKADRQAQNAFYKTMQSYLPVYGRKVQDKFRETLDELAAQYRTEGRIRETDAQRLFNDLYDNARVMNDEYYNQYKEVKQDIRNTRFYLPELERANIPNFEAFRKANFGNFSVTNDPNGVPVDTKYAELATTYPELFPEDITNPAAQLEQISEVSKGIAKVEEDLDSYYGMDAQEVRRQAKAAFDQALQQYTVDLDNRKTQRVEGETVIPEGDPMTAEENADIEMMLNLRDKGLLDDPKEADILRNAYQEARKYKEDSYKIEKLQPSEKLLIQQLLDGKIQPDDIPDDEAADLILDVYEARKKYEDAMQPIREYNQKRMQSEIDFAKEVLKDSGKWKDKKFLGGLRLARETMERNFQDIIPKDQTGVSDMIIEHYFTPVHEHEAERQRFLNKYRDQLREMKLTQEESQWVQMIGEGAQSMQDLPLHLDAKKIDSAITLLRDKIYPELYNLVSDTLMLNGYAPPGYIEGYFPHFSDPHDPLTNLLKMVGMDVDLRELPTEIAGRTETFVPGKSFFANLLHRDGNKTDYDALKGFDQYIEGASNVIFHTENIQRLRALENTMREMYGRKIKQYEDDLNKQLFPTEYFKDQETDDVFGKDLRHLSNLVTEIRSYTNSLAGKKSIADRNMEHKLGRGIYSLSKALEGRIAANMVGVNPASWITNFVPLTQGAASISKSSLAQAIMDTGDNILKNDGFEANSTFLTNRQGSKKVSMSGLEKFTDAVTSPMQAIDMYTANILVRGRYLDELKAGKNAEQAMKAADKWAASLMADRSKGALPTIFNEKNLLTRMFTMFQTEVNNQYSYLFKDLPRETKEKGIKSLVSAALQIGLYSFLANELYEQVTGRRPAFDPVGIGVEFKENLDEGKDIGESVWNLGKNAAEQIPFNNLLGFVGMDTGRYPVEAALPDLPKIGSAVAGWVSGDMAPNASIKQAGKELLKPAYYLIPPVGGGQLKKTVEGAEALLKGGSYSTQKDGSEKLQFPVGGSIAEDLKALTFGKSSLPQAQEYYDTWKTVEPNTIEGQIDAQARSLPRLVDYRYGEGENKQEGQVMLSGKEQQEYQEIFRNLLPDNMEDLDVDSRALFYDYAKQSAKDQILEKNGVPEYEPESWVQKMGAALDAGIGIAQYQEIKSGLEAIKGTDEKTGAAQKREALLNNPDLTPEQKKILDQQLISSETKADYTDANSFYRSQMSDSRQKKYDAASSAVPGITAQEFGWYMDSLANINGDKNKDGTTVQGSKKQKQIDYLLNQGFSLQEAYDLYNIQNRPSDLTEVSEYGVSYDAFSDSMKKQYQAIVSVFGETPTSTFEYYYDMLQNVKGTASKVELLKEQGFSNRQANDFVSILSISESDNIDFTNPDSILLSTLSDSQQQKYNAVETYIPGMPVSDFIYFRDSISNISGNRDQNGKTISGTSKQNKMLALMQLGMNYQQALIFYNIVG